MDIREIKPITFLFFRTETTVSELVKYLPVGQRLFKEAVTREIDITGPVHWHYSQFQGGLSKPFTLEISLPVGHAPDEYDGQFHFKRSGNFRAVVATHHGSWLSIPETYQKLNDFIVKNSLQTLGVNREVYVNVDFRSPEANTTEIQFGIL